MMSSKKIKDNFSGNSLAEELLIAPKTLLQELPLTARALTTVSATRLAITEILQGIEQRLLVIVGPCSIHDPDAALEYGHLLQKAAQFYSDDLCLVMRVYCEKPRTTVGWRGLISDPFLNGHFDVNHGLSLARKLLLQLNAYGVPAATEFLDTIIPHYLSDLIAWTAIGARTSASQLHRELASGLAMPVGFKNSPDGNIQVAIDAVQVAAEPHHLLSFNADGKPIITRTPGNAAGHVVLRGSHLGPNHDANNVQHVTSLLKAAQLLPRIIIDCSHGNSRKNFSLQSQVAHDVMEQMRQGSSAVAGIMLESNLVAGKQDVCVGQPLTYGQSITDGCISWQETLPLLEKLARVRQTSFATPSFPRKRE